jgi:transcriptional regulator with XRE-family HTH domain
MPPVDLKTFGSMLRDARRAKDWTQPDLADAVAAHGVKITPGYISRIETATVGAIPREEVLRALALALGANPDEWVDMAGRFDPAEVSRAALKTPGVRTLLRRIQNGKVPPEQLQRWLAESDQSDEP